MNIESVGGPSQSKESLADIPTFVKSNDDPQREREREREREMEEEQWYILTMMQEDKRYSVDDHAS